MTNSLLRLLTILVFIATAVIPCLSQNTLVNMVPNSRSGETNQDSEPTLAIDPQNVQHLAGSAFTWDNLTGGPMSTNTAPIYVSTDGGFTWTMAMIVPSLAGSSFPTSDITLSFSSTPSGAQAHQTSWLYGGILRATNGSLPMTVLRSQDPFSQTLMTVLDTRTGNVDQPHTLAFTSGAQDKLYVGFNNGFGNFPCPPPVAPGGRSSTVDVSQDATLGLPMFGLDVIEQRNSNCQDGFAQVVAAHKDGTVYAAFIHDWSNSSFPGGTPRLVVVRDDNFGNGVPPFSVLTDPGDNTPGRFVTPGLTLASGFMGQNRLGASNVSIAVDPNNSGRVYVAWGDANGNNSETVHVQRSIDHGQTWSGDLLTITNAMNPEIAINALGVAGLFYQTVANGRWENRLTLTNDIDATTFVMPGTLFASQDATTPGKTFDPYIGDYASLLGSGSNFVGMFSASNFPDPANFLAGVIYKREVDWTSHKLFTDASHTVEVPPSIDPFFFQTVTNAGNKAPIFANICLTHPELCYPIYDPWWWLKCPMCGINIYINPGDEFQNVAVFDSLGNSLGQLQRLAQPLVENGVTYTYSVALQVQQGVGFVLQAQPPPNGGGTGGSFLPLYTVKLQPTSTRLALINGWINAPFSTSNATVEQLAGIVHFKGAIASGSSTQPFVLPVGFRPATDVYVPVDLCGATNGRLHITPSGSVDIQAEHGTFSNAQCFTSLDGASFAPANTGFTPLTLINGWTNAPFSTSNAAVENIDGIVHFKGAIASGSGQPFVLPLGFRPATDVYVPVDLCGAANGRLHITSSGTVDVQAEGGATSNAQCFTSLDGASFAALDRGFTPLTLINGWTDAPFSTSNAGVENLDGIVRFKGAIASGSGQPFVLPFGFRPATDVYIKADLCGATNGRLHITSSGTVDVQAENGTTSNAQCFTSLDGASFAQQ